jgi:hypothetical protein
VQVVDYAPSPDPEVHLATDGTVRRQPLPPGTDLAYTLGTRSCAGRVAGDTHISCEATAAPHCGSCTDTWICAKCTGTCLKDEMDCYEEHAVYLAAFAPDIVKVGVTRRERLDRRLREQGADRGAHIHTVSNGRIAREIEAEIADRLTDRVRVPDKVAGLHRSVDEAAWKRLLEEFDPIAVDQFDYGLALDDQPIPATVATGTVLGVQGRVLVLERGDTVYAVDLRSLVGHDLTDGQETGTRQANLGAF